MIKFECQNRIANAYMKKFDINNLEGLGKAMDHVNVVAAVASLDGATIRVAVSGVQAEQLRLELGGRLIG